MDAKHDRKPTHIPSLFPTLAGPYQPSHVLTYNNNSVRVALLDGTFIWHAHPETDELFYVVSGGPLQLEVANAETNNEADGYGAVTMRPGDMFNVPRGVRHRPNAQAQTQVLFLDRSGTINTGDAQGTAEGAGRTVVVDEGGK